MARIEVFPDRLIIKLTAAESALAMRRREIVLSRDQITSALLTEDPWVWIRGVRSPGSHVPTKLALGTWRSFGGRDFYLVRSGRSALVLDFEVPAAEQTENGWIGEFDNFARVILSTEHAAALVSALRLEGENAVFDTK